MRGRTSKMALPAMLKHARKRKRYFFPPDIPGLVPLSKSEVNEDLDALCVVDEEAPEMTHDKEENAPKPSKRTRLVQKLRHELDTLTDLSSRQLDLRKSLDNVREESMKLQLDIAALDKAQRRAVLDQKYHSQEIEEKKKAYMEQIRVTAARQEMIDAALQDVKQQAEAARMHLEESKEQLANSKPDASTESSDPSMESALKTENERLKMRLHALESSVMSNPNAAIIWDTLKTKIQSYEALQDDVAQATAARDASVLEAEAAKAGAKRLQGELEEVKKACAILEERPHGVVSMETVKTLEMERDASRGIVSKLEQANADLQERAAFAAGQAQSAQLIGECAEHRALFAEKHTAGLHDELVMLRSSRAEIEKRHTESIESIADVEVERNALEVEAARLRRENADLVRRVSTLKRQNKELAKACIELEQDTNEHIHALEKKESALSSAVSDRDSYRSKMVRLEKQVAEMGEDRIDDVASLLDAISATKAADMKQMFRDIRKILGIDTLPTSSRRRK